MHRITDAIQGTRRNLAGLAVCYTRSVDTLRFGTSKEELIEWGRRELAKTPDLLCMGVNGDALRARVMYELFNRCSCDLFVETGTFRGSTSMLAAQLLRSPVVTSELVARSYWIARARCARYRSIDIRHADSREFLRGIAVERANARPLFYLDAHWGEDLPLQEELNIINSTWRRYAIIIDDFEVPGEPGYGFDIYEKALTLSDIELGSASGEVQIYYPSYSPEESGPARRGYVVLLRAPGDVLGDLSQFPMSLLRRA